MHKDVPKKIASLRKALGMSQEAFAKEFGVKQATVSRWEDGLSNVARSLEAKMASLADMSVAEFFHSDEGPRIVPVIGEVSAGEHFCPVADGARLGGNDFITFGSMPGDEMVAVRVRGDSMAPVYRAGDIVIGRKVYGADISAAINRDCIVLTESGDGFLKVLRKGSRKSEYALQPYNSGYDTIERVAIEWAAPVLWVKRA
jgi:repressor LexA